MKNKLSDKQKKILDFVKKTITAKGYPPSVREICKAVGLSSTSTVHMHLNTLDRLGYIKKDPSIPRALRIIDNSKDTIENNEPLKINEDVVSSREIVSVPIVGRVAAGQPILAVENIEDVFPIPVDYTNNSTVFMLKIYGSSMIDAGILDGDLVLVKQQSTAVNGDIVIALIDDEATCKTFYKEKGRIRLQPENKDMEPIYVYDNISVIGKVIGVFRLL